MNEHNVCPGCGEVGRATTPPSSRSFRLTHESTCGDPGTLAWLPTLHLAWDIADDLDPVDLREVAFSG